MRKTAAYIASIFFLFFSGLAILHPSYELLSSWLSPLTGGFIYTIFIVFTLLFADPFKYLTVGLVWVFTGLLIGFLSQKKLGSTIVAFFTWVSMIPTFLIAGFGIYKNLEMSGLFTIDSVDKIIEIVPNVPAGLNFSSLFELPIISELFFQLLDIMSTIGENSDPTQVMVSILMPHVTSVVLKPILIIVFAIIGAVIGQKIISKIDLNILLGSKMVSLVVIGLILTQSILLPLTKAQTPELSEDILDLLTAIGADIEDFDMNALAEMGISIEDLEMIAEIGPENIDLETLTGMGIDMEVAMGIMMGLSGAMNSTEGTGPEMNFNLNTDDGIYLELLGGFVDNQGRAVSAELLLGNEFETVSSTASYVQDLAASFILTQKIFNPRVLYTLPFEGIADYVQFAGVMPELVAVNVYAGEDIDAITVKSDQLITEYETLYGIEFNRVTALQQEFGKDEGSAMEISPLVICVYYSLDTFEQLISKVLTGFEEKGGIASSFQEIIESDRKDIELYIAGQITPSYLQTFISLPKNMTMFQDLIDIVLDETFNFAIGTQLTGEAIEQGNTFDLVEFLGIDSPRFSSEADIGLMTVIRPNSTNPEPSIKLSTNIDQASMEFMFLYMYLNSMMPMEISGGTVPSRNYLRITLPDYSPQVIDLEKTSQTSRKTETVSITLTNNGNKAVSNLELVDPYSRKYGILSSGSNDASWVRLNPGESKTHAFEVSYENPGIYTNMPSVLTYQEGDEKHTAVSNILQERNVKPSAITLLSNNYGATFELLDMLTGKGDLFKMVPLVFIAFIAAVDAFKIFWKRSTSEPQVPEEPSLPEPPNNEDNPVDLP